MSIKFDSPAALSERLNGFFEEARVSYEAQVDENQAVIITDGTPDTSIRTFLIPVQENRTIETNNNASSTITTYFYNNGVCSEPIEVPSGQLLNKNRLINCWGLNPFADFGDMEWELFFAVAKIILKQADEVLICDYSDWNNDNSHLVYGSQQISADGIRPVNSCFVTRPTEIDQDIPAAQAAEFLWNIMTGLCKPAFISITAVLYYLLSLLKSRLYRTVRFCPSFALAVIGRSGTRKTSMITPLGNPIDGIGCSFEDTSAAIQHTFHRNTNGCTVIDDFNCHTKEKNRKFEDIIRLAGDITTNGKRMVGQKVVTPVVTGMAIFTGEDYPKLQPSSIPRVLFLELLPDTVQLDVLTALQHNMPAYRRGIALFVQFIIAQGNTFDTELVSRVTQRRDQLRSKLTEYKMHGRYHDMIAWMLELWQLFKQMAESHGVAIPFDYESGLKEHIIQQHIRHSREPVPMFLRAWDALLDSNSLTMVDYAGFKNGATFDVIDETDTYFVISGVVYQKIVRYYREQGLTFPCSERELRRQLQQEGILKIPNTSTGKLTVERKTKDNQSRSGWYLYKSKLGGYENE